MGGCPGPALGKADPGPDLTDASQPLGDAGIQKPMNANCLPSNQQLCRPKDFSQRLGLAPRFPSKNESWCLVVPACRWLASEPSTRPTGLRAGS